MITIPFLPRYSIVLSNRHDGSLRSRKEVLQFLAPTAGNQNIIYLKLEHGSRRALISASENEVKADALITSDENIPAMIVADCFPIIIIDPKHHVLAMIHGGWRSLLQNIIELTCQDFVKFGGELKQSYAWIGPGLRSCCNTSTQPPVQAFFPEWQQFVSFDQSLYHVSLEQFILDELQRNGVLSPNIFDYGICTSTEKDHFFSHRRAVLTSDEDGRSVVSIVLEKKKTL